MSKDPSTVLTVHTFDDGDGMYRYEMCSDETTAFTMICWWQCRKQDQVTSRKIDFVILAVSHEMQILGRVSSLVVSAAELAVTVHCGPHTNINATYGALGAYVSKHALAVVGPVREYYLVDARTTSDATQWRTEIGWPIFQTAKDAQSQEDNSPSLL